MLIEPHPGGIEGFLADLRKRIAEDDDLIAEYSAERRAELQSQGAEAVIAFLLDLKNSRDCTPSDREALLRFLLNSKS